MIRSIGSQPVTSFASYHHGTQIRPKIPTRDSAISIRPPIVTGGVESQRRDNHKIEAGRERTCTAVAALVDTNILVYRFDSRFPRKQKTATEILRRGIAADSVRVPHQAILEFVAAVTRPIHGRSILRLTDALREAEEFLRQFIVLYPNEAILHNAIRGCAAYQLSWFDAHLWAYAEHYGLAEILTEDLQHDRLYGTVRVVNPFLP